MGIYFDFVLNIADIDECMTNAHDCHSNASCTDTDGSFTCMCNDGFEGNGTTCTSKSLLPTD